VGMVAATTNYYQPWSMSDSSAIASIVSIWLCRDFSFVGDLQWAGLYWLALAVISLDQCDGD